jgi:arsenate reductase (glutaredoxin)
MQIVVYGIANCDQVKKTKAWLKNHGLEHRFHDFRKDGIDATMLDRWFTHVPWDALLNRRGTTWRQLDPATQKGVTDAQAAKALFLAQPSIIKRPVMEIEQDLLIGFNEQLLAQRFGL